MERVATKEKKREDTSKAVYFTVRGEEDFKEAFHREDHKLFNDPAEAIKQAYDLKNKEPSAEHVCVYRMTKNSIEDPPITRTHESLRELMSDWRVKIKTPFPDELKNVAPPQKESFTMYELDGKYIPASTLLIDGKQELHSTLQKICGITRESAGNTKLHLDFLKAYKDKKIAIEAVKKEWGSDIHFDNVKLKQQYSVVNDKIGPVAVKESLLDTNNNSLIQQQTKILKQGQLGRDSAYAAQHPVYALATVVGCLKTGEYTQKKCTRSEFNSLQKSQYGAKKLFPDNANGSPDRGSRRGQGQER